MLKAGAGPRKSLAGRMAMRKSRVPTNEYGEQSRASPFTFGVARTSARPSDSVVVDTPHVSTMEMTEQHGQRVTC